jgi:hypothetical protein
MTSAAEVRVRFTPEYARIRVPLDDSKNPSSLGKALDALVDFTSDVKHLREVPGEESYLVSTFHTPAKKWIRERVFFTRCAKHPALHPAMLAYVANVNLKARGHGPPLAHTDFHPAGSFAIVPLVLADPKYIGALIDHLRGWDMDHESWHAALIDELLRRHGVREETIRLLAWRAVESDGQTDENLVQAVRDHSLLAKLEPFGGLDGFAERAHALNQRKAFAPLYIANGGRALCTGDPAAFARWLAWFEARGVVFEATDRAPPKAELGDYRIRAWPDGFEDDEED